jgi:GNAT superfamily N-acetyltransferase
LAARLEQHDRTIAARCLSGEATALEAGIPWNVENADVRLLIEIVGMATELRLRPATRADLPRIHEVRRGTAENLLTEPTLVTDAEVEWYIDQAIFLVSEDGSGIQGFTCVNHQTGYVWALFVVDEAQGRGHGSALLNAAMARLREAGHRQAFLSTGCGTKAEKFYRSRGCQPMGTNMRGELVLRLWL